MNGLSQNTTHNHLLKIGLVANIFEWYEFVIYAYMADVIGQLFFHSEDPIHRLIQAFAAFAIGYLARPLGSLFFGAMGDRVGRGAPIKIMLVAMAVPTALIGLLPTYQNIGWIAPLLLLALRLTQGFALGGELPGTACYIFEAAPSERKSILCSVVVASIALGSLLATLVVFLLFQYFDRETIHAWAWRIPFLLSIPLTVAIGYIRREIHHIPLQQNNRAHTSVDVPKQSLLKTAAPVALICAFLNVFFYTLVVWMPSYLIYFLNYPHQWAYLTNTLTLAALVPVILFSGYAGQLIGYQRLMTASIIMAIVLICPLWFLLQRGSFAAALATQLLLVLPLECAGGVLMEMLARQFPPLIRCRGMNLAYTFPIVLFGGTAPFINTWMIQKTGLLIFPALYIMFFGILALPFAWRLKSGEVL